MMKAGDLKYRLRFERRAAPVEDGYGNRVASPWLEQFTVSAGIKYLLGSESVIAARLEGRQPAIITVRASLDAKDINHEWRAVDVRSRSVFALKEPPRDAGKGFIEILAEGIREGLAGPSNGLKLESGEYLLTEAGDYIIQEAA